MRILLMVFPRPTGTGWPGLSCWPASIPTQSHMVILETERLILRHFHRFDDEAMHHVFGDADVMRYGGGVQTEAWVRD